MLEAFSAVAFVPVSELSRARDFYERVLGLTVVVSDERAVQLDAHGTRIRLTAVPDLEPRPFTVLGWEVVDAEETARALAGAGVETLRFDWFDQDALGVWSAPSGDQVAWFADPDGNVLSITEARAR
ncbi:MAG: VOC family protein [Actinobacteria bacterium]|nr:VOC family protein [Actinomycetota bacterium]